MQHEAQHEDSQDRITAVATLDAVANLDPSKLNNVEKYFD
jgi:hypothetical protein